MVGRMNNIEFRTLRPGEWDEAVRLWVEVFGNVWWIFETLNLATQPREFEHTQVAIADGQIIAAVDIFLREQFDANGQPRRVGAIGSVATRESFRGQGISGTLLKMAIAVMNETGCTWSFLGTGVHKHYERYGWFRTPVRERSAGVFSDAKQVGNTTQLPDQHGWHEAEMAELHRVFNDQRPLSHIRTARYWKEAILPRMQRPERTVWGTFHENELTGYVGVRRENDFICLEEIAAKNSDPDILRTLISRACLSTLESGLSRVHLALPKDDRLEPVLNEYFGDFQPELNQGMMSRANENGLSKGDVLRIFDAPGAIHYSLDNF